MKKAARVLGTGVLALVALIGIGLLFVNFSDLPSYSVEPIAYRAESSPTSVARGHKLALMLCAGCHINKETGRLTGKKMTTAPPELGEVYAQNITQDKDFGIGGWTDGELLYLLRTGVKRDGSYAPPYMMKLPHMADEDVSAIISFLRSEDLMVAPDPTPDTASVPSLLTKVLCRLSFKPLPMPAGKIEMPDPTNGVALGKYLALNLDCYDCHSHDFKSNDPLHPELSRGYFAGGNSFMDEEGRELLSANLTPDLETGIGSWTKANFVTTLKYGMRQDDYSLRYPMMPYTPLSDEEAGAIYEYLRTIPAIKSEVPRFVYE